MCSNFTILRKKKKEYLRNCLAFATVSYIGSIFPQRARSLKPHQSVPVFGNHLPTTWEHYKLTYGAVIVCLLAASVST